MTTSELLKEQSLLLQQLQAERDDAIARARQAEASTSDLGHKYNDLAGVAGRLRERAKAAEAALAAVQRDADKWKHNCFSARRENYGYLADAEYERQSSLEDRTRAETAEATLAAVPIAKLRRIIEMHNAHQWSSVESPPLWAKVESWLKEQR